MEVLVNGIWIPQRWDLINVGDIVRVKNNTFFPADLLILSSRWFSHLIQSFYKLFRSFLHLIVFTFQWTAKYVLYRNDEFRWWNKSQNTTRSSRNITLHWSNRSQTIKRNNWVRASKSIDLRFCRKLKIGRQSVSCQSYVI